MSTRRIVAIARELGTAGDEVPITCPRRDPSQDQKIELKNEFLVLWAIVGRPVLD